MTQRKRDRAIKQLTIRGFNWRLERRMREVARREGISLNRAALRILEKGADFGEHGEPGDVVGDSLDRFIGSWSSAQEDELLRAIEGFEQIDDSLWS